VLLTACRGNDKIDLKVNSEVLSYEQDGTTVTARLSSGVSVSGSALIGADGLWSNVRKQVVGDAAPRVSGHTSLPAPRHRPARPPVDGDVADLLRRPRLVRRPVDAIE
jgi:2-polyprenyl-6-methoxyphenol hydroxylase-like FAD-dependent oxidoreductase